MNKEEFRGMIKQIEIAYDKPFSKEKLILWWNEFKNIDIYKFNKAVQEAIKTCKFIPTVADLYEKIQPKKKAWQLVEHRHYEDLDALVEAKQRREEKENEGI